MAPDPLETPASDAQFWVRMHGASVVATFALLIGCTLSNVTLFWHVAWRFWGLCLAGIVLFSAFARYKFEKAAGLASGGLSSVTVLYLFFVVIALTISQYPG